MKPVLIIQHQENDGPAYLERWLKRNNVPFIVYRADLQELPSSIHSYSALAILGGAISANDVIYNNFRSQLLILQAIHYDIPVIGHCLGGQLLAKALGASIYQSPKPEVGWQPIEWSPESLEWVGESPCNQVMQWHYEAFELPEGATLIASSLSCPNQAFILGNHIGMQFHIEVDTQKIIDWTQEIEPAWLNSISKWDTVHSQKQILNDNPKYIDWHNKTADAIYTRWLRGII